MVAVNQMEEVVAVEFEAAVVVGEEGHLIQ